MCADNRFCWLIWLWFLLGLLGNGDDDDDKDDDDDGGGGGDDDDDDDELMIMLATLLFFNEIITSTKMQSVWFVCHFVTPTVC